jgi:acylpyruvate hydrolase
MKIICIGRNYSEHIRELNNTDPGEPVIFLKPDTAMVRNNEPVYLPSHSSDVHYEGELVFRVCRSGKHIEPEFALRYLDAVTVGVDLTARDVQERMKEKRLPWEIAKAFDQSAPVGVFLPLAEAGHPDSLGFSLSINGEIRQQGNASQMIHPVQKIVSYISRIITLKTGDLIFTGTPSGVGPLRQGDRVAGKLGPVEVLNFEVR